MRKSVCLVFAILMLSGCKNSDGGGGASGSGASGTGGGGGECAMADKSVTGSALHAGAAEVLANVPPPADGMAGPCGFGSCHVNPGGKAQLSLKGVTDLRAAMVGKASCEAPAIPLVDGKGGDAALQNSWLWLKLTAPAAASGGALTMQNSWPATAGVCGQMSGFGTRMPQSFTADVLDAPRLAKIRNWICAGAPGP